MVNDEGRNPLLLKKAGVADADFLIALTGSDEVNLITCGLVGGEYRGPAKIARVRNPITLPSWIWTTCRCGAWTT